MMAISDSFSKRVVVYFGSDYKKLKFKYSSIKEMFEKDVSLYPFILLFQGDFPQEYNEQIARLLISKFFRPDLGLFYLKAFLVDNDGKVTDGREYSFKEPSNETPYMTGGFIVKKDVIQEVIGILQERGYSIKKLYRVPSIDYLDESSSSI